MENNASSALDYALASCSLHIPQLQGKARGLAVTSPVAPQRDQYPPPVIAEYVTW